MPSRRASTRRLGLLLTGRVLVTFTLPLLLPIPSQRLAAEAEAYCAEADFGVAKGGQARLEYARIQDELREMAWFRRLSSEVLNDSLASQCPMIAVAAAREEADWQARRNGDSVLAAEPRR
jgi:hypothetical protein